MFNKVDDFTIYVYDGETSEYLGRARFNATRETERLLLDMVNYGKAPDSIILQNVELYEPSENYVPPTPYQVYKRRFVISALFSDANSGEQIPIEIQARYDVLFRSVPHNDVYQSAEYSNIVIEDIRYPTS